MLIVGTLLVGILYGVIRRSPRRWWFYFWLASIPIVLLMFFLQPIVVDPLFYTFKPLAGAQPVLVSEIQKSRPSRRHGNPRRPHVRHERQFENHRPQRLCHRLRRVQTRRRLGQHHRQSHRPKPSSSSDTKWALRPAPHPQGNGHYLRHSFVLVGIWATACPTACSRDGARSGEFATCRIGPRSRSCSS